MSADFWAGYLSGAIGILIGNPLDLIKVRLQAHTQPPLPSPSPSLGPSSSTTLSPTPRTATSTTTSTTARFGTARNLVSGAAAPAFGYGALNALLFVSYNRTSSLLTPVGEKPSLWTTWIAGAVGGLATWVVSAPTEVVKCRAQMVGSKSSWAVARDAYRTGGGVRGLYLGGAVTALRDSLGYGFYFWSYELGTAWMSMSAGEGTEATERGLLQSEAARVLLCGGVAGIITWASIFPLDVIKTRVQTQAQTGEVSPLLSGSGGTTSVSAAAGTRGKRLGAIAVAREAYREGGMGVFFRGLGICSLRAFVVNAVQWAVYEWAMRELGEPRTGRIQPDFGREKELG